jgi:hypothetical protein
MRKIGEIAVATRLDLGVTAAIRFDISQLRPSFVGHAAAQNRQL